MRELALRPRKSKNIQTSLRESVEYMTNVIDQNFGSRGGVWGKWKKRKKAYPWQILEKTGARR